MNDRKHTSSRRGAGLVWLVVILALAGGGTLAWYQLRDTHAPVSAALLYTVQEQDLRISVLDSGQLMAADSVDIFSEIRGQTTVLQLIDEGSYVREGEVLVQLDASDLEDELTQQKIKYEQAYAAWVQAKETKAIQESANRSNIAKAELGLALARTDLEKFREGDWPLQLEQALEEIKLYEVEKKTAEQTLEDTRELVDLNFAAQTELERDELAWERARVNLQLKLREREIMEQFEYSRQLQVLESDITEFDAEKERVVRQASADLAQAEADLRSKEATLELEKSKLEQIETQLSKAVIRAPSSGLVVYPTNSSGRRMGDQDRVQEGSNVREHQLLISLPDTSRMLAALEIHESAIDKIDVGQPALVTIDAIPDTSFYGKVSFVASLPDSANQWLNPDLKVYRVEVLLSGNTADLRPGMSVSAEIVVDELKGVIAVPVHAVYREGSRLYTYAERNQKPEIRPVTIGPSNDTHVQIVSGLEVGDRVYMAPPPGAPRPEFPPEEESGDGPQDLESLRAATANMELPSQDPEHVGEIADFQAGMERWQNASPEEREKMTREFEDRMKNMTPEQLEKLRSQFGGERWEGGDRDGEGSSGEDRGDRSRGDGRRGDGD